MAKEMTDYDKQIDIKKKELAKIQAQIKDVSASRDKIIKEGNQIIYDNKAKAEKIITDANAKAEGIVSETGKIKSEAEAIKKENVSRSNELTEKEKVHVEAVKATVKDAEKLAQDKIGFGKQMAEEKAKAEVILAKVRELIDVINSARKSINVKMDEIVKL